MRHSLCGCRVGIGAVALLCAVAMAAGAPMPRDTFPSFPDFPGARVLRQTAGADAARTARGGPDGPPAASAPVTHVLFPPPIARHSDLRPSVASAADLIRIVTHRAAFFVGDDAAAALQLREVVGPRGGHSGGHTDNTHSTRRLRLQQLHHGVPVVGGEVGAVIDPSIHRLRAIDSGLVGGLAADVPRTEPTVAPAAAVATAVAFAQSLVEDDTLPEASVATTPDARLAILPGRMITADGHARARLVFEVDTGPYVVYVCAHTRAIVQHVSTRFGVGAPGLLRSFFYNEYLEQSSLWYADDANNNGVLTDDQRQVLNATETLHRLFYEHFGLYGYDNEGSRLVGITDSWCPGSAFAAPIADPNVPDAKFQIYFCDGYQTEPVVSHEFGHVITFFTHNLPYMFETGALNEAYSDILGRVATELQQIGVSRKRNVGECVQGRNKNRRWLIDAILHDKVIRDMWSPHCTDHPESVTDNRVMCTSLDNFGVHFNSAIPNRAFALLVDGGLGVDALGLSKATYIYVRAMLDLQNPGTGFKAHANALVAACVMLVEEGPGAVRDLFDHSSMALTEADCDAVGVAMEVTEMSTEAMCPYIGGSDPSLDVFSCTSVYGEGADDGVTVLMEETFDRERRSELLGSWREYRTVYGGSKPPEFDITDGGELLVPSPYFWCADSDTPPRGRVAVDSPEFLIGDDAENVLVSFRHKYNVRATIEGLSMELVINGVRSEVSGDDMERILLDDYIQNGPWMSMSQYRIDESSRDDRVVFSGQNWRYMDDDAGNEFAWSTVNIGRLVSPGDRVQVSFLRSYYSCASHVGWLIDEVRVVSYPDEEAFCMNLYDMQRGNLEVMVSDVSESPPRTLRVVSVSETEPTSQSPSAIDTQSQSQSPLLSPSPSPSQSQSPSANATQSQSLSQSQSPSSSATQSQSPSPTQSPSLTQSESASGTQSQSPLQSVSSTASSTQSMSSTLSPNPNATQSQSQSPSANATTDDTRIARRGDADVRLPVVVYTRSTNGNNDNSNFYWYDSVEMFNHALYLDVRIQSWDNFEENEGKEVGAIFPLLKSDPRVLKSFVEVDIFQDIAAFSGPSESMDVLVGPAGAASLDSFVVWSSHSMDGPTLAYTSEMTRTPLRIDLDDLQARFPELDAAEGIFVAVRLRAWYREDSVDYGLYIENIKTFGGAFVESVVFAGSTGGQVPSAVPLPPSQSESPYTLSMTQSPLPTHSASKGEEEVSSAPSAFTASTGSVMVAMTIVCLLLL